MIEYGTLLCGTVTEDMFEFGKVMDNLHAKLDLFTNHIIHYDWSSGKAAVEIPFYARNVLEASLTAIMGRLDPFRVVTVYKVQEAPEYDLGRKSQSAIEWYGDIIGNKKASDLWNCDNKKENFDRALLGNYQGAMIWEPGFRALSDYFNEESMESDWLNEMMVENEHSNFEKCKSMSSRLFSSFSKGVHSECLVDITSMLDIITVKSLVKDMYKLCSMLGLVSNFIGYLVPKISKDEALRCFLEIEGVINNV